MMMLRKKIKRRERPISSGRGCSRLQDTDGKHAAKLKDSELLFKFDARREINSTTANWFAAKDSIVPMRNTNNKRDRIVKNSFTFMSFIITNYPSISKSLSSRNRNLKSISSEADIAERSAGYSKIEFHNLSRFISILLLIIIPSICNLLTANAQAFDSTTASGSSSGSSSADSISPSASSSSATTCFGGLQTFEKISMSTFENPSGSSSASFGGGILVQQDDQALTSECVNLCRTQANCLSFVIDYNKFECKSYATTQQELQQEFDAKFSSARSTNSTTLTPANETGGAEPHAYLTSSASTIHFQHLLPSASSNYFEKICLDGVANKNQINDVCGQGRLWTIERVVDSFLDGFVEKEVTNVNNKDECSKLCIFETQFVCRSADYDQHSRLCRLSKEDRRTQPQAMRQVVGSNRQYLENQCATPGPSSCVYETKKNYGIISMDALKFAQTVQDCQMRCNQESTFNCRSYSFYQQRCFLSGDDSSSLNSNLIKLPMKQGWQFGEKKCLVELCTKGIFSYEKITGYTLRSALSTPIDLMMLQSGSSSVRMAGMNHHDDLERLNQEASQTRAQHAVPTMFFPLRSNGTSNLVTMMMMAASNSNPNMSPDPMHESASTRRNQRSSSNNLAITDHCRHSCDLGYLNCPAFTIDYRNNRCQRLDRNSQGRHQELVARDGYALYEKICLRVPEIMSMCQDKYWIFERVIGYELAPRLYDKSLKFVQSRRDCEEYCLEEKQFQCRSALYNDETSDCKLSRLDRRLIVQEGGYYRNFNSRVSYLENQCIRDHGDEHQCAYEQAKDEPSYPTFTEHIEMVQSNPSAIEIESTNRQFNSNSNLTRHGSAYCEQLCNDNAKFECHSFGYYASTAQCFLSGDDSVSAGESATTSSTGFTYFEKKCRVSTTPTNYTMTEDATKPSSSGQPSLNPYLRPGQMGEHHTRTNASSTTMDINPTDMSKPVISNNNNSIHFDQRLNTPRPQKQNPQTEVTNGTSMGPDQYKCGPDHTFVYQRISGFEPIGGYLTLLVKNNEQPGIVAECSELCKRAYECRAFVVDYNNNQCFAMLENSSVGLLSLRQTLGKDYFEGFCTANHILIPGNSCKKKTWVMDKIVDQAVIGVQHQKIISDSDKAQCRQACLEERLFWCKSAMFDDATGDCKLYSIDRESMPQMRLLFTKGVDFFENQCQIVSSLCPYDAIERDMTIVTATKSLQARSTFDCEQACNSEVTFNCRSYTYLEQYPSLPNLCLLSSDSRSTSQKGSVREHQRTLYAERNCYYRRARYPGATEHRPESMYTNPPSQSSGYASTDPYMPTSGSGQPTTGAPLADNYNSPRITGPMTGPPITPQDLGISLGQNCEPHQYTFERTFGYDYRLGQKERAPIPPTIGIAIGCQQECLRRGDRCQSFVVEYALPYQSCFLIATQVGSNKKLLVKSSNSAYFEKMCIPRTGVDVEQLTHSPILNSGNQVIDMQSMDIAPSYSQEPWSPQVPNQLPYYLQQQQLIQNYPSRSCAKLWSFERFINHNFTAPSEKVLEDVINRVQCETHCLNEAAFSCRAATFDYSNKICRLFKNTRRTIMSQFVDLDSSSSSPIPDQSQPGNLPNSLPGTAHILTDETELIQQAANSPLNVINGDSAGSGGRRQASSRQISSSVEAPVVSKNIDYMENTCISEPSSCQYRQLYDAFNLYIDKINHAVSLNDCQRQCDLERLFSCKSINYDPSSRNCMLINEDLISLNRGQQASLLPKKNTIYSEKGNCEMISVQCNSQEMLVSINFDSPFKGRVMAKGNPEQCFLIGDGQTSILFPIVFGPKCNSRQEGHNTFVNEVVIQQHPVIMTDSDKTVRVMCAFEAPDQTITLKNPSSRDNKTGIDVGAPESSRIRHDKHFNPVVSNKASPPSVLLRILDQNGRDAAMINLGDDLILKIQMQVDGQNSALGIFARNLAAKSSSGESLLLIDNDGCPVDHQVFPALEIDPKDGKSLFSTFKAFRFPSSGLVNFEVQIRFCPERCQPVECHKGQKMRSYGRRKRQAFEDNSSGGRISILQSVNPNTLNHYNQRNPIEELSTIMKPGKAFQYVRELLLKPQATEGSGAESLPESSATSAEEENKTVNSMYGPLEPHVSREQGEISEPSTTMPPDLGNKDSSTTRITNVEPIEQPNNPELQPGQPIAANEFVVNYNNSVGASNIQDTVPNGESDVQTSFQKSILMHVDEKVVPSTTYGHSTRGLNQPHSPAPYGRYPLSDMELHHHKRQSVAPSSSSSVPNSRPLQATNDQEALYKPSDDYTTSLNSNISPGDSEGQHGTNSVATPEIPTNNMSPPMEDPMNDNSASRIVKPSGSKQEGSPKMDQINSKEVPLRFSILVGENQGQNRGWTPNETGPVLSVMNSTNVDHIVIPGKDGQFEHISTSESKNYADKNSMITTESSQTSENYPLYGGHGMKSMSGLESTRGHEQTFDAQPSNSVGAEIKLNHPSTQTFTINGDGALKNRQIGSPSESAASHDCPGEAGAGSGRLWTIIWTGTFVIALNVCLVILSLVLYFKKVHFRQNHNIVRATSECGTHSPTGRYRWPSVLLKSKNNLGTSLNTHEHFFCKLNSKTNVNSVGGGGASAHEFNWPNLSSSSSHSTISSMASPLPVTNIRIHQTRNPLKPTFDSQSSLRNNFPTGHKSILDVNSYDRQANYLNNIDESHQDNNF